MGLKAKWKQEVQGIKDWFRDWKVPARRRYFLAIIGLMVACGIAVFIGVMHLYQGVRLTLAKEQIGIFEEMKDCARKGDVEKAAGCLSYTITYYPSGTKQHEGSQLDWLVETARRNAIANIIGTLRKKTGEDLGEDPAPWIKKYAKR